MTDKTAKTDHPVHELISARWSPRAISSKPVERSKMLSILEAARWAPSSFNEQPWRYVVATSDDPKGLEAAQSVLMEGNSWAKSAPVLICSISKRTFTRNDNPNRHAMYDAGAATENMFLEAFNQGLVMHEMAGFDTEKAREVFEIPDGFVPAAMIAVGYLEAGEEGESARKPLAEIAFANRFGQPLE